MPICMCHGSAGWPLAPWTDIFLPSTRLKSVNLCAEECALRYEKSVMQLLTTTVELTSKGQRGWPDERRVPRDAPRKKHHKHVVMRDARGNDNHDCRLARHEQSGRQPQDLDEASRGTCWRNTLRWQMGSFHPCKF